MQQRVMAPASKRYLAAGVAMIALVAAGEAFISPMVSTPLSQPSSAAARPVRQISASGSKAGNFWQAASAVTLLSLSMVRFTQRRQGKAARRKISVACFAAPSEPATTFAIKEIRPMADLINMTDVTITEAHVPACADEVQQNVSEEASTSPAKPHAARFIGASRFRSARAHPHRNHTARHATGKRLCERPSIVQAETSSYDVSRLREKIQKGLRISQRRCCGRSREGRGVAASCRTAVGCHSLMEVELHVQKAYNRYSSIDRCSIVASSMESAWEAPAAATKALRDGCNSARKRCIG